MSTTCVHGYVVPSCPVRECIASVYGSVTVPPFRWSRTMAMQAPPPQPAATRDEAMARVEAALALLPSDAERALLYLHLHEGLDWRVSAARLLLQGKGWRLA